MTDLRFSYGAGEEIAITATKSFTGSLVASWAFYSILSDKMVGIDALSLSIQRLINP